MNLPWSKPPAAEPLPPPSPPDEEMICYCFHVPRHKIENFIRRERPEKVSMISYCLGAGTGCGTCVPDIKMIYKQVMAEIAKQEGASPTTSTPTAPAPAEPAPAPSPTGPLPVPNSSLSIHHSSLSSPPVRLATIFTAVPIITPRAPVTPNQADSAAQKRQNSAPEDRP